MSPGVVVLFLCGDVMTGRGVDQILPHPCLPELHESFMTSALGYVEIAEEANGPIRRAVPFSYIWGDALQELERAGPAARIINLETSVTVSEDWELKGINYRMNPSNIEVLTAARIDACALANNHVLDWGERGLLETLEALKRAGVRTAGAGKTSEEANAPAVLPLAKDRGRVVLFSLGVESSGVPPEWAASENAPGVSFLTDLSEQSVRAIQKRVKSVKRENDIVVVSIHWGGNWGYEIPVGEKRFAHALIDEAGVDLIHGHSSHHAKGFEVYGDKLILYGCGDFLNDYEGIRGYEEFRDDLALMYLPEIELATGRLASLRIVPLQIRNFSLHKASEADARWFEQMLNREGKRLGTRVRMGADHSLSWARRDIPCKTQKV